MLESFKLSRGLIGRGLVAGAVLAAALTPAIPAFAVAGSISWNPSTSPNPPSGNNHAVGDTFTMAVVADAAGTSTRAYQVNFTWDPAVLKVLDYQVGATSFMGASLVSGTADTFLGNYIAANPGNGLGTNPQASSTINNTTGALSAPVGDALSGGSSFPGPSGTGQLMVVKFQVVGPTTGSASSLVNFVSGLSGTFLSPGTSYTGTLNSATVFVGPVPTPNLAVSGQSATGVGSPATSFNVGFTVTNNGTGNMASPGSVTVTATNTGTAPANATQTVNALPFSGSNSQTFTAGPFALNSGQTLSTITIKVSCGTNNPCSTTGGTQTTAYQFSTFSSTGQTTVTGSNPGQITLTAPANASLNQAGTTPPSMIVNKNNDSAPGTLTVQTNLSSFAVTVASDKATLSEFDTNTGKYVGTKSLAKPLTVQDVANATPAGNTGTTGFQSITTTPTGLVSGTLAGQDPANGAVFTNTFEQFLGFNDPSIPVTSVYQEVVTYAAAGTF